MLSSFSLRKLSKLTKYGYSATGWKDLLLSLDDEEFEYDSLGNLKTYKSIELKWNYLRNLEKFGDIATYTYNASGIRTHKKVGNAETQFYLNGNKIISQITKQQIINEKQEIIEKIDKLLFYYGIDGLTGFNHNGTEYIYKKNIQNDIVGIYDNNGQEIVKYTYDAWGNCTAKYLQDDETYAKVEDGYIVTDTSNINRFIAFKNPFRYRSYYYDEETKLYYLNSRYYDPQIGRFINADDISYLDKSNLNGLNLYNYCLNNPVNLTDNKGTSWWSDLWDRIKKGWDIILGTIVSSVLICVGIFITIASGGTLISLGGSLIGAGVGGLVGGIDSKLNGGNYWAGWLGGTVSGGLAGLGAAFGPIMAFIGGAVGNFIGTLTTDSINGDFVNNEGYWKSTVFESIISGLTSIIGQKFSSASEILIKIGFTDIFAGIGVWSEFAFNYLAEAISSFFKQISQLFRKNFEIIN